MKKKTKTKMIEIIAIIKMIMIKKIIIKETGKDNKNPIQTQRVNLNNQLNNQTKLNLLKTHFLLVLKIWKIELLIQ